MKGRIKGIVSLILMIAVLISVFAGCTAPSDETVFDVATELGYAGTQAEWLASVTGADSQERQWYLEAKAEGYEGTFVQFLQELGQSADDSVNLASALMSVVSVRARFNIPAASGMYGITTTRIAYSQGSGVIYSLDRAAGNAYIITNHHVVYEADSVGTESLSHISDEIVIYLYGTRPGDSGAIRAQYVGGSMQYDIAVLSVTDSDILRNSTAQAARAADSDAVTVGEQVYAAGNAEGGGISLTAGVISVDAEYIDILASDGTSTISHLVMRTDAAINHGNSGGALFNAEGRLIGITSARSEEDGVTGFGYAIPSNYAISLAQNILDNYQSGGHRTPVVATLGVTVEIAAREGVYDEETERVYTMETVRVSDVSSGIAQGQLSRWDIFYSVQLNDAEPIVITRMHMIGAILFNVRKGDTLTITLSRGGTVETVTLLFDDDSYFTSAA